MTGVLLRRQCGDTQERSSCDDQGPDGKDAATNQEMLRTARAIGSQERGKEGFFPGAISGSLALGHLDSDWPPEQ